MLHKYLYNTPNTVGYSKFKLYNKLNTFSAADQKCTLASAFPYTTDCSADLDDCGMCYVDKGWYFFGMF